MPRFVRGRDVLLPMDSAVLRDLELRRCLACGSWQAGRAEALSTPRCSCGGHWREVRGEGARALAFLFLTRELFRSTPKDSPP